MVYGGMDNMTETGPLDSTTMNDGLGHGIS